MVYIIATVLRKALELGKVNSIPEEAWCELMLTPYDYSPDAIAHPITRILIPKITFEHGGKEYDDKVCMLIRLLIMHS